MSFITAANERKLFLTHYLRTARVLQIPAPLPDLFSPPSSHIKQSCVPPSKRRPPMALPTATPTAMAPKTSHPSRRAPTRCLTTSRRRTSLWETFSPTSGASRLSSRPFARASNSQSASQTVPACAHQLNLSSAYFDLEAKIKIAKALDEFGVDCEYNLSRRRP